MNASTTPYHDSADEETISDIRGGAIDLGDFDSRGSNIFKEIRLSKERNLFRAHSSEETLAGVH